MNFQKCWRGQRISKNVEELNGFQNLFGPSMNFEIHRNLLKAQTIFEIHWRPNRNCSTDFEIRWRTRRISKFIEGLNEFIIRWSPPRFLNFVQYVNLMSFCKFYYFNLLIISFDFFNNCISIIISIIMNHVWYWVMDIML